LTAARAVFADQGHDAQMDDVARRAEVGVGTVYRHFPTKEALIDAIALDALERLFAFTTAQVARVDADPWEALEATMWAGAEILAGDRAVAEVMAEMTGPMDLDPELQRQATEAMHTLISRAQAAGALRPDVIVDDIIMVMCGVGTATRKPHMCEAAWRRHLAILLDGLRASAAVTDLTLKSCS
jgi:AcrR family transcriptional regulator